MNVESYRRREAIDQKRGRGRPPAHATIKETKRIASPELLPKLGLLPHLICSRQSNLGSGDEEGEHGDASGIDFGDQRALRLGRTAGKGKDSG
jgi:hypothetical protein